MELVLLVLCGTEEGECRKREEKNNPTFECHLTIEVDLKSKDIIIFEFGSTFFLGSAGAIHWRGRVKNCFLAVLRGTDFSVSLI